jgi:hypothetical protein
VRSLSPPSIRDCRRTTSFANVHHLASRLRRAKKASLLRCLGGKLTRQGFLGQFLGWAVAPPIHGQSCCMTRHDTNTTKHDTIRHEHSWTRLPFVSCRVRRRAKTSTRTRHEGHRAGTTTRPAHRAVSTRTRFTEKNFIRDNFSSIQHSTTQTQSQFTNSQSQNITEHHRDNTEHHRDNFFKFEPSASGSSTN